MTIHRLSRRTFLAAASAGAATLAATRVAGAGDAPSSFRFEEADGGRLQIRDRDRPVLTYTFGDQLKKSVPERYRRSCYCHPVRAPDGTVLTDDFPKDHYHHRGIFWAWPRIKARGQAVQTWHLQGIRQRHHRWNNRSSTPEYATLDVTNDWVLEGGERVGCERLLMVVRRASTVGRAIDFTLTFEAVDGPVELLGAKGKGYGGFSFRFAPRAGTVITTDTGIQEKDSDRETPKWADLSARFGGGQTVSGTAIFVHPGSRWKPTGWTIRHYGFLGPSWPGLEPYTLEPGAPVTLRYRVYVHCGSATDGKVAEAYDRYANTVEVIKIGGSE